VVTKQTLSNEKARAILGVSADAATSAIAIAYKKAAKKTHPDLNPQYADGAKFRLVNQAYQVLNTTATQANLKDGIIWQSDDGLEFHFMEGGRVIHVKHSFTENSSETTRIKSKVTPPRYPERKVRSLLFFLITASMVFAKIIW
jgi:hypothetical protein